MENWKEEKVTPHKKSPWQRLAALAAAAALVLSLAGCSGLRATLTTAKEMGYKRLIAVHQPFTYSRTKMLFNDFVDVLKIPDITVLTPIMGSREPNDPTITSAKLAAQIPGSVLVNSLQEAADWVKQNAQPGDLVITLGCGDIYKASKMMVEKDQ